MKLFFSWRPALFRWQYGRQKTGYEIMTFLNSKWFKCDLHLIRYRTGASILPHRDPVNVPYQHFRINIVLWPAKQGGELICEKSLWRWGAINFFRPDETIHSVTEVTEGARYVLSCGWKRKKRL